MKKIIPLLACSALLFTQGALANGGHDHGPQHGGVVREVGSVTLELVAKANSLTLHVSDHEKPIVTPQAKAQITLYAGNEKTVVVLEPAIQHEHQNIPH